MFLLSLKAGGVGLTLTRATHVVHYDRWWNPAVEDQATDRAYRIGQDKPVQVHRLVTENTLEDRISTVIASKRDLADAVVGSGEAWLSELSDAELTELVELSTRPVKSGAASAYNPSAVGKSLACWWQAERAVSERVPWQGWRRQGEDAGLPAAKGAGSRRPFGATWWGKAWLEALEHRARLDPNRLGRGRSYARRGSVLELTVDHRCGRGRACRAAASTPYQVTVRIRAFTTAEWDAVLDVVVGADRPGRGAARR